MVVPAEKRVNLIQLQAELEAAGVLVPALGLSQSTDGSADVHTYTPDGRYADLPPAAAPVVAAHQALDPDRLAAQQRSAAVQTILDAPALTADPALQAALAHLLRAGH